MCLVLFVFYYREMYSVEGDDSHSSCDLSWSDMCFPGDRMGAAVAFSRGTVCGATVAFSRGPYAALL
jgi:hypothetical protein